MYKKFLKYFLYGLPIGVLVYYYTFDPAGNSGFFPVCFIKKFTGFSCSGCGTQRALHSLLHGRFLEALHLNAMLVLWFPFFILLYKQYVDTYILKDRNFDSFFFSNRVGLTTLAVVLVFTVIRNVPIFAPYLSA